MSRFDFTGLSPEHYARELLFELGITQCPTPVQQICQRLGIELTFVADLDADAYLLRLPNKVNIIIKNSSDTYHTRQRFSIAHELGHYRLPDHQQEYKCNFNDLMYYSGDSKRESEANRFAAELLMPIKHFHDDVKHCSLSLVTFIKLSEKYETSLMACALRFLQITDDMGAVIVAKNNRVSWSKRSESFRWEINDGLLQQNTCAHDFHMYEPVDFERRIIQKVALNSWVATPVFEEYIDVIEETLWSPNLKQTLTVIRPSDEYFREHDCEDDQI